MQVAYPIMVSLQIGDRIEVRLGEVADIQVDLVVVRHGKDLREAFRSSQLIGIGEVRVIVKGDRELMLVDDRDQLLCDLDGGGSGDNGGSKGLGLLEHLVDLLVGKSAPIPLTQYAYTTMPALLNFF